MQPEDLNLNGFTHVNFAFAFFDPTSFEIAPMDSNSAALYRRFTALKDSYKGLQTWISVGGWSFTDPGPTRQAFSDMASNSANRQKFISSIKSFMNTYGFDGMDIDWASNNFAGLFLVVHEDLIRCLGISRRRRPRRRPGRYS